MKRTLTIVALGMLLLLAHPRAVVSTSPAAALATQWKDKAYTTTQTGATYWQPASGFHVVVTSVDIQCGGTTAGTLTLWFGASGDTTFTQDTDQPLTYMDCNTPSATNTPGKVVSFQTPIAGATVDYYLKVTTSAAITARVIVYGYEQR